MGAANGNECVPPAPLLCALTCPPRDAHDELEGLWGTRLRSAPKPHGPPHPHDEHDEHDELEGQINTQIMTEGV